MSEHTTLDAALAAAQGEFEVIKFDKEASIPTRKGGLIKFKYASHGAVIKATRGALSKHGIAVTQIMRDGKLVTQLRGYGEVIESELPMPGAIDDWKVFGGALTYAKRYGRSSILDVAADEDTDATIANEGPPTQRRQQREPAPAPETITADEAYGISETMRMVGGDVSRFCAHFGVRSIKELPKSRLAEAQEMLKQKIKASQTQVVQGQQAPPPVVGTAPDPANAVSSRSVPAPVPTSDNSPWGAATWVQQTHSWLTHGGTDDAEALGAWWDAAGDTYQQIADQMLGHLDDADRELFDALTEILLTHGYI